MSAPKEDGIEEFKPDEKPANADEAKKKQRLENLRKAAAAKKSAGESVPGWLWALLGIGAGAALCVGGYYLLNRNTTPVENPS